MELRPYQLEAAQAIGREWDAGRRRTMAVMATGCGKTVLFADMARRCVEGGGRALVMAHRSELLGQAADKIMGLTGLGCSVEKAQQTCADSFFPITVGSVQTLCRDDRLEKLGADRFQLVIGASLTTSATPSSWESRRRPTGADWATSSTRWPTSTAWTAPFVTDGSCRSRRGRSRSR